MNRLSRIIILTVIGLLVVFSRPGSASGAVRVVDDEVIFTLNAPGAEDVFLVGDFNNWNATLDKMEEVDGKFEAYLFLIAGAYRYKFVVDGEWITDPDNPPAVPEDGSLLVLEERAGMLLVGDSEVGGEEEAVLLQPSGRYSGAFILEDNKTRSKQALDFYFDHESKLARARVNFKTTDDTWDVSPLTATINFDRGHLDFVFDGTVLKAFENDTMWTSSDPFALFGRVGVYDYNAGYERRGTALELPLFLGIELKGLYADKIGPRLGPPPAIGSGVFEAAASPDTAAYRHADTHEDADTWGFELLGDMGSFATGYTKRENRGFNPGLLVETGPGDDGGIATATYTTREFFNADALWLRWTFWRELSATGGYGWGDAEMRTQDRSVASVLDPFGVTIGQDAQPSDRRLHFQKSRRAHGALGYAFEKSRVNAAYECNEYEFDAVPAAGLAGTVSPSGATARIQTAGVDGEYTGSGWSISGAVRYLDQDYGETPVEFDYFTPGRNFWLDYRDKLTVENMVAFDLRRSTQLSVSFAGDETVLPSLAGALGDRHALIRLAGGLTSGGFFETIEQGFVRFAVELGLFKQFYAQWDSRLAWYNKSAWDLEDTFFSTYLEAGYRVRWAEISLGFGLDPNVLDPVRNAYADIGREEYLRRAIFAGLTRDDSALLGARLGEQEKALEDLRALKLEVILYF